MISGALKPIVTRIINPVARGALHLGLTPNAVTTLGAIGLIFSALYFYPREEFFIGTLLVTVFSLSDLFDGAMARISHSGASRWGAFLDSTLDRITDSAIIVGLLLALISNKDPLAYLALVTLVTGLLVSYIRAKAESLDIECSGGIAERTERLVIILCAIGFEGLQIPYALTVGIWLLALLGIITVLQRLAIVRVASR